MASALPRIPSCHRRSTSSTDACPVKEPNDETAVNHVCGVVVRHHGGGGARPISAAGGLLSWEPFDLSLPHATLQSAEAAVVRSRAEEALTHLDLQTAVGNAFLFVVIAEQAGAAAEADDSADVFARVVHTLADNKLRPGADVSRADAELAAGQRDPSRSTRPRLPTWELEFRGTVPLAAVALPPIELLDPQASAAAQASTNAQMCAPLDGDCRRLTAVRLAARYRFALRLQSTV